MAVSAVPKILAHLLAYHGITDIVVSSGSRNAPLIHEVSKIPSIKLHTVIDERCAGFVALGMSLRQEKLVGLICTSGTALLNYAPAVAEAYYRNQPIIVISADRPMQWIDQDDGQTIRQFNALSNIVKSSYNVIPCSNEEESIWYANRIINEALLNAKNNVRGPVHINIPIDLPYIEASNEEIPTSVYRGIDYIFPRSILPLAEVRTLINEFIDKKIAVIVGTHQPDAKLSKALSRLAHLPNVVVFHEAQSNVKGLSRSVGSIDSVISVIPERIRSTMYPDLLISLGGTLVSQKIKVWLRNAPCSITHWQLGSSLSQPIKDTYKHLAKYINAEPAPFFNALAATLSKNNRILNSHEGTEYTETWHKYTQKAKDLTSEYADQVPWSDFTAVRNLFAKLNSSVNLHISNGLSIRYAQISSYENVHRIDANRGCNGIDGSTSTAIGAAIGCKLSTVLLTGDMSALYDLGALTIKEIPDNFSMFILNNKGGDIFRFIGNTCHLEICEERLAVPNSFKFKELSQAFNFKYAKLTSIENIEYACSLALAGNGPYLFEIDTTQAHNSQIFRDYFIYLKSKS